MDLIKVGWFDDEWNAIKEWFMKLVTSLMDWIFAKVSWLFDSLCDLIGFDPSVVTEPFNQLNAVVPVDVLLVDFGIVLGVWFTCLIIRVIISIAPTIGG